MIKTSEVLKDDLGRAAAVSLVALPFGVLSSFCLLGVLVLAWGFDVLVRAHLGAALRLTRREPPPELARKGVGAWSVLGLAVLIFVVGAAASVASHLAARVGLDGWVPPYVAAALACLGAGATFGPLLFTPYCVAHGAPPLAAPWRSFAIASQLGPRRTALLGATAAATIGFPALILLWALGAGREVDLSAAAFLAGPFAVMTAPLVTARIAARYAEVVSRDATDHDVAPSRRLEAIAALLLPVGVGLLVALTVAAFTPTPLGETDERSVRVIAASADAFTVPQGSPRGVPGASFGVRRDEGRVYVEAWDGGGTGAIEFDLDLAPMAIVAGDGTLVGGPPGSLAIVASGQESLGGPERYRMTLVDADGVRLDDGVLTRTFGRLGAFGAGALGLGVLCVLGFAFVLGREIGEARALDAPRLEQGGRGVLSGLEGELRLADGQAARVESGELVVGDAWFETDAYRFRLPPRVPLVGEPPEGAPPPGVVTLLSHFRDLSAQNLRQGPAPLPADARLVLGPLDRAAAHLVARASRRASLFAVPALILLVLPTVLLLLAV
ncbi:MAG: hypothetical protein VYE22_29990 [Myxococcota bacterium]|nr:hypothetical protein [Myxococcota bacterium]